MGDISFENRNLLAVTKHGCQRDMGFIAQDNIVNAVPNSRE